MVQVLEWGNGETTIGIFFLHGELLQGGTSRGFKLPFTWIAWVFHLNMRHGML